MVPLLVFLDLYFTRGVGFSFSQDTSFLDFRLPRIFAALLSGAALGLSGMALQTLFRNPLAGPFLTGITPGASFSIGILLLAMPSGLGGFWIQQIGLVGAGMIGGVLVLLLQLYISNHKSGMYTLLLTGVMIGYLLGAGVEIMQTFAGAEQIKSFVMWGLGSFDRVQNSQIPWFAVLVLLSGICVFLLRFKLDAWLPGEMYARNSGINIRNFRIQTILISGLLAGATTALCGPVGFIGLAAPHLSRLSYNSNNHRKLILPVIFWGAGLCIAADFIAHNLLENITLNVNAIAALIGAPVVLWVLLAGNKNP